MSLNRTAKQRDANEPPIVDTFRKCGWQVQRHLAWDLDVLCPRCSQILAIEVKTAQGRLTQSQTALLDAGWPIYIVRSIQDAQKVIGAHIAACSALE